ncbi:kinase-like domain-containing protein [Jimgerdemannia flammicorona]|nr:kinase-like domain-containing protein [Jimgerdemannia flammicorona]
MMRNTRHERILLFMGVCAVPPNLALVTALCEKGSLYKHIHVLETQFTLQLVVNIATQIAEGLEYLHARGLLHNDLKSHNILLNHQFDVKIGDFGLSSLKRDNRLMNVQGSVHWLAPEIVRMKEGENPYTEKSDVWSYGMILYELLTSQLPYEGLMSEQILWQIGNGQHPSFDQLRTDTPAEMRRLISSCWEQDPTQRRSFHEILTVMSATRIRVGLSMRRTRSLQGLRDMWSFSFPGPGAGSGAGTDIMGGRGHTRYW